MTTPESTQDKPAAQHPGDRDHRLAVGAHPVRLRPLPAGHQDPGALRGLGEELGSSSSILTSRPSGPASWSWRPKPSSVVGCAMATPAPRRRSSVPRCPARPARRPRRRCRARRRRRSPAGAPPTRCRGSAGCSASGAAARPARRPAGVAPSRSATALQGVGLQRVEARRAGSRARTRCPAAPCWSTSASSARRAMLYMFCTHTTGAIACASASCSAFTVLSPRWRISPCCCSSASAVNCSAIDPGSGVVEAADAQVDHVEHVEAEAAQVVVDLLAQLRGRARVRPAALLVAPGADLGDDVQVVRVRGQRLADELVRDVRAVEVGGVDVGDAQLDDGAQHGDRRVVVLRRPEDAGPGELHGAVADAGEVEVADPVAGEGGGGGHGSTLQRPGRLAGPRRWRSRPVSRSCPGR